jgi:hypothetical protein
MKPRDEWACYWARHQFARLAPPMQERARELGYALIWHGSLARDIDFVAVPWTEEAVPDDVLVAALVETMKQHNDGEAELRDESPPTDKPHGRRAWNIYVRETYFDVSVMPRKGGPDA